MRRAIQVVFVLSLILAWCGSIIAQDEKHSYGISPKRIGIEKGETPYTGTPLHTVTNAYGTNAMITPVPFISIPIPAGTPFTTINAHFIPGWLAGADMGADGTYYGCTFIGSGSSNLVMVDKSTGIPTTIGPITGFSLYPTSLAYNSTDSTWYFGSTDAVTSNLYTLNVSTGVATLVGPITGLEGLIGLAIDCEGNAYGVDIVSDQLYSVNLSTGAGKAIGPMGFDANYAQDCDFDPTDGTLYLASYDNSAGASLRTCDTSTGGTIIIATWPGVEVTGFAIEGSCTPCPVGESTNPSPTNNATNVPISTSQISWTNGSGITQVEVLFGEGAPGNMVSVYSGIPVTSWSITPSLNYFTEYYWKVVSKNDTCQVSGPTWKFVTELSPEVIFFEPFNDMIYWTPIGPLGLTNWSVKPSNFAGGTVPEAKLNWWPSFYGMSKLVTGNITTYCPNELHNLYLSHMCDWDDDPAPFMGIGISYDAGSTFTTIWEFQPVGGNVGPENIWVTFTPTAATFQFVLFCNGYSSNIDYWYIDDIMVEWIIPVELTSFTAIANEYVVELNWITATETNNQGFEIERKAPLSAGGGLPKGETSGEWERIGYVAGFGTTIEQKSYSYTDNSVISGTYYYRLKQIDFDGTYNYSNEIEVEVDFTPYDYTLFQNYPNPFNPITTIKFSVPEVTNVTLTIYNTLGQKVAELVNTKLEAGKYSYQWDASKVATGLYIYELRTDKFVSTKKMLMMK